MQKLARSASTPVQYSAWLDEMEKELRIADANAMRAMVADCRALIGEKTETLDRILAEEK